MAKLPLPPPPEVLRDRGNPPEWATDLPDIIWRIRPTAGDYPTRWNSFRTFGPLPSARFDPHEPPAHEQHERVAYFGADWPVCLAEVYQDTRVVDTRRNTPFVTAIRPTRPLRLLSLRGGWPLTIGASHHINTGRKDHCRAWARALRRAWPQADGLASVGINSGTVITLFDPARNSLGKRPAFDRPLADQAIEAHLAAAAEMIGYDIV